MTIDACNSGALGRTAARLLKRFSHWTPRYVTDRVAEILYQRTHPGNPWLTRQAVEALDSLLRPSDVGVEFGSGRSTPWFARRVAFLTSVEHDETWFGRVSARLAAERLDNVDYRHVPIRDDDLAGSRARYTGVLDRYAEGEIDFVLIDGRFRSECAERAIPRLKTSGLLIIDNVNRYLPSRSCAPDSRAPGDGPYPDGTWQRVHETLAAWRVLWSSSGVTDTAIFFKP